VSARGALAAVVALALLAGAASPVSAQPTESDVFVAEGILALEDKKFDEALAHFRLALDREPDHLDALYYSGVAHMGRGKSADAVPFLEKARALSPGETSVAYQLGLAPTLDEPELAEARSRIVLASRAAGLENPIDSPWFHFKEAAAFTRALERSRRGGFQGRLCVHPDQIGPVNAAYLPGDEEVARAERIVAAFREAEARGAAAIQVDGQMIDYPVAHRARAVIESVREAKARKG